MPILPAQWPWRTERGGLIRFTAERTPGFLASSAMKGFRPLLLDLPDLLTRLNPAPADSIQFPNETPPTSVRNVVQRPDGEEVDTQAQIPTELNRKTAAGK